jgi:hypothetical protein
LGNAETSGANRKATAATKTALVRAGSADDEKKGAKTTIPLTRIRVRTIALKKLVHSAINIVS